MDLIKTARFFLLALLTFSGTRIHFENSNQMRPENVEFIVWNVGQGLWTTYVDETHCHHFDMGGEHAPWPAILKLCHSRENILSFSHWDWDHIRFAREMSRKFSKVCMLHLPAGEPPEKRRHFFASISDCDLDQNDFSSTSPQALAQELRTDPPPDRLRKSRRKTANEASRVFVIARSILAPGDSTKKSERYWAMQLKDHIRIFVLGHHGSRTSTSADLLVHLAGTQAAVVSARKKKYGHPHPEVVARLRNKKIPILLTEEWGSLRFQIKPRVSIPTAQNH